MKKVVIVLIASLASLISSAIFAEAPVSENIEINTHSKLVTQAACVAKSTCVLNPEEIG